MAGESKATVVKNCCHRWMLTGRGWVSIAWPLANVYVLATPYAVSGLDDSKTVGLHALWIALIGLGFCLMDLVLGAFRLPKGCLQNGRACNLLAVPDDIQYQNICVNRCLAWMLAIPHIGGVLFYTFIFIIALWSQFGDEPFSLGGEAYGDQWVFDYFSYVTVASNILVLPALIHSGRIICLEHQDEQQTAEGSASPKGIELQERTEGKQAEI